MTKDQALDGLALAIVLGVAVVAVICALVAALQMPVIALWIVLVLAIFWAAVRLLAKPDR